MFEISMQELLDINDRSTLPPPLCSGLPATKSDRKLDETKHFYNVSNY